LETLQLSYSQGHNIERLLFRVISRLE